MNNKDLAHSFRRIGNDLLDNGHPANSSAKAILDEAERLDPPRAPREWTVWVDPMGVISQFGNHSGQGVAKQIKVLEILE